LREKIGFNDIARLVEYAADSVEVPSSPSLQEIFEIDDEVRRTVAERAGQIVR